MSSTIDQKEIAHFAKDAANWWDEDGPFAPLHRLNPARLSYLKDQICGHYGLDAKPLTPFKDLSILDIGCGGGLVCEPMARLGANVTGADADAVAIKAAQAHAVQSGLDITYFNGPAESLIPSSQSTSSSPLSPSSRRRPGSLKDNTKVQKIPDQVRDDGGGNHNDGGLFDVVLALEILEHVSDPAIFVQNCANLVKPGGLVIFSTLNRNPKSYLLGIIAAEYLLRWVPQGTHEWKKFIKPSELARFCRAAALKPHDITGLMFHPLEQNFKLSKSDLDVNYFMTTTKQG